MTKCLHIKYEEKQICKIQACEILDIFKRVFGDYSIEINKQSIFELIDNEAEEIIKDKRDNIDLQNKIILSIVTRLKAEKFMFEK